jgi:hypothetical protein
MVQHLSKETSSIGAPGEAEEIDVVSGCIVAHQELYS